MAKKFKKRPVGHAQWYLVETLAWNAVRADAPGQKRSKQAKTFLALMKPDAPGSGVGIAAGVRSKGYG